MIRKVSRVKSAPGPVPSHLCTTNHQVALRGHDFGADLDIVEELLVPWTARLEDIAIAENPKMSFLAPKFFDQEFHLRMFSRE